MDTLPTPRMTPLGKMQWKIIRDGFRKAMDDLTFRSAFELLVMHTAEALGLPLKHINSSNAPGVAALQTIMGIEASNPFAVLDLLTLHMRYHDHDMVQMIGDAFLRQWLADLAYGRLTGKRLPWFVRRIGHLAPDNPIIIRPDESLYIPDGRSLQPKHAMQLQQYYRSRAPARKPGPRPTAASIPASRRSGKRLLDPELSRRARELKDDRHLGWRAIADMLYPARSLRERRREAMRAHINRLVFNARKLGL